MKMNNPVLILGAGISGLGAAYKLSCNGQQTVVLEKDTTYGGLCGNFTIDGFRFDRFVHFYDFQKAFLLLLLGFEQVYLK